MSAAFDLGPFRLDSPLGKGAMGSVWGGVHRPTGSSVAVKLLHAQHADHTWFQASFKAEVRAVARLASPHIVPILGHGVLSAEDVQRGGGHRALAVGTAWLAMVWLPGKPMSRWRGRASWPQILAWTRGLLSGLGHAHARGVLHRDLKPANVLVNADHAVLVDFGLARELNADPADSHDGLVVGTRPYMAPEQFDACDAAYGPWTDLYALGCVVWALVTGTAPFGHRRPLAELHHDHALAPLPELKPRMPVPPALESWLGRLLSKSPLDRFRAAAEARAALDALARRWEQLGEHEEPDTLVPGPRRLPVPERWPAPPVVDRGFQLGALSLFRHRTPPLVGRADIQSMLWSALRDTDRGDARVVLLQGPAGSGKSHIARWLCEAAHEAAAATVISARHGALSDQSRGGGLVPAFARALGLVGADAAGAWSRLQKLAHRWGLSRATADDLRALFLDTTGRARLRSAEQRNNLIIDVLDALGAERPVVLLLDDVHWGPDSLAFVDHLLARPPAARPQVLVVMTAREVPEGSVAAALLEKVLTEAGAERVPVGPLAPGWRRVLVQSLAQIDDALAEAVEARTEGHPLFTVQLLGDWVDRGLLVPGPAGLTLREGAHPELPSSLHAVWERRVRMALDTRSLSEQRAVELAAILGTHVYPQEWRAACEAAGVSPTPDVVDDLLAAGLAQPHPRGLEHGWSFVHGMLRESLVSAAEDSGWAVQAREGCVKMLRERASSHPRAALRLGHHLLALGRPTEAIEPLSTGAWAAVRDSEDLLAERALADREAVLRELCIPATDPRWGAGWLMQARVARRRGATAAAETATQRLLRGAEAGGRPWRGLRVQAHREAARLAELRGELHVAAQHAGTALFEATTQGDALQLAWCRRDHGLLRVRAGARMREVDGALAGAQATFAEVGEVFGEADCLRARAVVRVREQRGRDADPLLRAARRALRRSLSVQEPAHAQVGLGDVARLWQRSSEAARWYAAAWERFVDIGRQPPRSLPWWALAVQLDRGRGRTTLSIPLPEPITPLAWVVMARSDVYDGVFDGAAERLDALARGPHQGPEVAEQLERLAADASQKRAHALASRAASQAEALWEALGWPARASRVRRRQEAREASQLG